MGNEFYFGEMDVRRLERLTDAVERLADNLEKQAVKVEISDAPAPRLSRWMIEKRIDGVPHWWTRKPNQYSYWDDRDRWTTNPNIAKQYDTRADAEYVIGRDMVGCVATEHVWIESDSGQAPGKGADNG